MIKLKKGFQVFGNVLNVISMLALLVMVCITIADIFLRQFFKAPIVGAVEITRMMMVCMTPSFVSALMNNRHVNVGLIVDRLPRKGQLAFDTVCYLASAGIAGIMCYRGFIDMRIKMAQRQVYTMLKIPSWPFYLIFAIAMGFFAIAIVFRLIEKYWDKDAYNHHADPHGAPEIETKEVAGNES